MTAETTHSRAPNVEIVERFLAAFDHRWPGGEELTHLLTADVRFVERPNLVIEQHDCYDQPVMP